MLIAEKLLPIYIAHIRANQLISGCVHDFDSKSGKVTINDPWSIGVYRMKLGVAMVFISCLVVQFFLYRGSFPMVTQIQCVFFIVSYAAHAVMTWALWKKSRGFAAVVNSMLEFERKFNARMWVPKRGNLGKKVRHTLHPFLITPPIFASFVGTYLWTYPCFPGNLGFMLIDQCNPEAPSSNCGAYLPLGIKVSLILFQVYMVNFLVASGCYYAAQYLYCMCHCVSNYLVMMCRKQVKEQRDDQSTREILKSYTDIRLLTFALNRLFGDSLALVVGSNTFLIIIALYAILSSNTTLFQFIFLSISTIDRTMIITEAFGQMGKVNSTSKYTLMKIRLIYATRQSRNDRLSRKLLRAFPQVMIMLGSVSYFDELFATSNIDFIIKQTAGLLVI